MDQYNEWLKGFSIRLRTERERQGLTRSELANRTNTTQDFISQLERGSKSPSVRTLINVLLALDISADTLIFGVTKEKEEEMEFVLNKVTDFLKRRTVQEATALYEIINFLSRYILSRKDG